MNLFVKMFTNEFDILIDNDVKVIFSGRKDPLSNRVLKAMNDLEEKTKNNKSLVLNICLNYGGQSEIVDMVKKISKKYKDGEIELKDIDSKFIQKFISRFTTAWFSY